MAIEDRAHTSNRALALKAIQGSQVLVILKDFHPKVVSTHLVELDTVHSDIDIVCCFEEAAQFEQACTQHLSNFNRYSFDRRQEFHIARFSYQNFVFEVVASHLKTEQQLAYRHHQIMRRLVQLGGERLIQSIRAKRQQGMKVEPALVELLELGSGDPYLLLLDIENWTDVNILRRLQAGS